MAAMATALAVCTEAGAQDLFSWSFPKPKVTQEQKVKFIYDADFDFKFDNREFDAGDEQFTESMTLFGARLTPSIGLRIRQNGKVSHKLMAGIDVFKEFGRSPAADGPEADKGLENTRLFREMTLYYGIYANLNKWRLRGYAGIFPRALSEGAYSQAFFSDSLLFYDNNLEGILFKAATPRTYMEIALDWNGKYGESRREQFSIFGYGRYEFTHWLAAGLAFKYHHYADAAEYGSVVDDGLDYPFVRFDIAKHTGFQELSLTAGMYAAMQQDRRMEGGDPDYSFGGELTAVVQKWNVGFENRLYYGQDLMPYYNYVDDGGYKYGHSLYSGSPFYRITPEHSDDWAIYDRMELYYQPHIADFLDLRLSIVAHFPDGFKYAGMQQKFSLIFSLDKLLNPVPKSRASYSRQGSGRGSSAKARKRRPSDDTIIFGL